MEDKKIGAMESASQWTRGCWQSLEHSLSILGEGCIPLSFIYSYLKGETVTCKLLCEFLDGCQIELNNVSSIEQLVKWRCFERNC